MKRILATEEQLKVKKGDRVAVSGYRGTVTEVYIDETEDYIKVQVRVRFDPAETISKFGQYQNGWYNGFEIIDK